MTRKTRAWCWLVGLAASLGVAQTAAAQTNAEEEPEPTATPAETAVFEPPAAPAATQPAAAQPTAQAQASVKGKRGPKPPRWFMHGFRIGYAYFNFPIDEVDENGERVSPLKSPHTLVMGYELTQRWVGGSWLNVITVENAIASGINQNLFIPSANVLLGFEMYEQFQVGVGANLTPLDPDNKSVHMILAAGYTPRVGTFNVPFHIVYIPDVDQHWRLAVTTGVNW